MEHGRSLIQVSISYILLAMIALYGLSSVGNIVEFIQHFHDGWTGWSLGLGFGLTLFVSAYIASIAKTRQTRIYALIVAGCFGLSSAWFQMSIYLEGGANLYVSFVLAFVPIVVGEVGLAMLESSYSKDHEIVTETSELDRMQAELDEIQISLLEAVAQAKEAEGLKEKVSDLQQALQESIDETTEYRNSAMKYDGLAKELAQLATERDKLAAKLERAATEIQQTAINVDLLPQRLRSELQAALEIVAEGQITAQHDFVAAAQWSRSKAQEIFRTAEALKLIRMEDSQWRIVGETQ
ncbi:MAG: hypothetical protein AAF702_11855 [Chloroflexota bacterium]